MNSFDVIRDLLCGCAGGVAQVVTMMPIQNIMTKMITQPQKYKGFFQSTFLTIKEEGIFSFYKGMLMPLLGVGAQVSLQFGVVETLKKIMTKRFGDEKGTLAIPYIILCGSISGIPSGLVVTPLDHARFRVLMNKQQKAPGSVRTAINITKQYGIRKLFLGLNVTVLRQIIGLAIYFGSYDFVLQNLIRIFGFDLMTASFQAGGIAGMLCWSCIYPIHFIKVKIQTDDIQKPKYKSATECARQILGKQIKSLYRGVGLSLTRAYIVNGATFIAFEKAKKFIYSKQV